MTNSPRQEIFTMCRQAAVRVLGEDSVFDYLPGKEASYPFVFIGEQYGEDTQYKNVVAGDCTQTIHVYHNDPNKRGTTQNILDRVLHEIRKVKHTRTFYIELVDTRTQMLTDNTTSTPLLHGVLELRLNFIRRGKMAQAKQGKKIVLLWRLLKDAAEQEGTLMLFQTEHSTEKSRDGDSVVTKTGTIRKSGELEEEVPFTSLAAIDDPVIEYLETAIDDGELLELWEVDMNQEPVSGKYPAKYRQGYLTELSQAANAEDEVEISGTFATNMKAQKGEATFSLDQMDAVQYQFRDTIKVTATP